MSAKRIRGKNFSEQEEHVLIDLVLLKKDILQDKKKDAATWRRKAETWEQLAAEFRAQTGTDRTCAALREKYDNMKKNSRNKYRGVKNWDHERELSFAGSSWCSRTSMTDNNEGHIGNITTPLENQFDSDGKCYKYVCKRMVIYSQYNKIYKPKTVCRKLPVNKCSQRRKSIHQLR